MKATIDDTLRQLEEKGNYRRIPGTGLSGALTDFTSNDYLGLGVREDLRREFCETHDVASLAFSASASRLLAADQQSFADFESFLSGLYDDRQTLLFNSGYHANTGLVSALSTKDTMIIADRLVHASIIDGIKLGGARFERFRHNDVKHLSRLVEKAGEEGLAPLIIVESVYSMDGDRADIEAIAAVKRMNPDAMLYVDEAHAVGVCGPQGLGLCKASEAFADVDIIVGTLGKALASVGAFAILGGRLRDFAVNKARSLIFSTALPPLNVEWSRFIMHKSLQMEAERSHLRRLGKLLSDNLAAYGVEAYGSHIQPFITGDSRKAIAISDELRQRGFNVLPIRTPTVPPGTERLRISLSAALAENDIEQFGEALRELLKKYRYETIF